MSFLASASAGIWLNQTFSSLDMSVFQFFGSIQCAFLNVLALIFTAMGESKFVALFALFGLVLVFFRKTRKLGLSIVFAVIIGTLLTNILIKPMVMRVRPYNALQNIPGFLDWYKGAGMFAESDFCFPSGHSTGAMEIAVVLCLCLIGEKKGRFAWIPPLAAVLVGCSRVYLMVHYASDVMGGWIIGLIAGIAGYFIAQAAAGVINRSLDRAAAKKGKKPPRDSVGPVLRNLIFLCAGLIFFMISFIPLINKAGSDIQRCAYDGDYKCYNEAETSDKYPAIDGKNYCKIHWKELNK